MEEASSRLPAYAGNLVDQEGRVLLRTYVDDLRMAARYLAGLGWRFTVLDPPQLRAEVRALAQELLQSTG